MTRCDDVEMRKTATTRDDVLVVARALAARTGESLGRALSELARRGFRRTPTPDAGRGGATFRVPVDAPPITTEDVRKALSDWP